MFTLARLAAEVAQRERLRFQLLNTGGIEPHLLYAGQAGSPNAVVTGGRVKLLPLSKKFPEKSFHGNILYLVTSGLPKGAIEWARQCQKKGIKVVVNQNGVAYPAWASDKECRRINERNRQLLLVADYIFYQSEFCREAARKWVGIAPDNGEILYNPINADRFVLGPPSQEPDSLRLLLMGSHRQPERVLLAIDAVAILRRKGVNTSLKIAGPLAWENAMSETLQRIRDSGLENQVKLLGPYLNDMAAPLYQSSDVLIHLQDKDASPTVPLEALACGLQVVAPRSGGLPELIPQSGGSLLDVEQGWDAFHLPTPESIAEAAAGAFKVQRQNREKNRQWVVERFSLNNWLSVHERIFRRLLHA